MNRGGLGARSLNVELQKALNPPTDDVVIERFGYTYRVGDKVMQTNNDYDKDIFNGDLGYVRQIDLNLQEFVIEFDGKPVEYQFGELDDDAALHDATPEPSLHRYNQRHQAGRLGRPEAGCRDGGQREGRYSEMVKTGGVDDLSHHLPLQMMTY